MFRRAADPLPPASDATVGAPSRRAIWGAAALIVAAVFAAYAGGLTGPFVYDDQPAIALNPTIRGPLGAALLPPAGGLTVSGRPVLNVSFALNFAAGGLDVRGYHLTNVAIHALAALALFGCVRRTRLSPRQRARVADGRTALLLALAVALLWALHPLHTEAVTYVVQRAESLMGLFYLLTLYGVMRATEPGAGRRWTALAIAACALGLATKENMVSAPLIALLWDRTFAARSWTAAWRQRRGLYAGLAATWLVTAALLIANGLNRAGSMGFATGGPWSSYVVTQFPALARYLALAFWPQPLVFDYGPVAVDAIGWLVAQAGLVIALVAATLVALWRWPAAGFCGAWFFCVLAPTSLLPAKIQQLAEHRMYLPLAAVMIIVVLAWPRIVATKTGLAALALLAVALGLGTARRNEVYRDEISLWRDTVAKRPNNALARANLASALAEAQRVDESIAENRRALALQPDLAPALATLGGTLAESGRPEEGLPLLERARQLDPDNAKIRLNLGVTLDLLDRPADALVHYESAVRLGPLLDAAHNNYGDALARAGRVAAGIVELETALRLNPKNAEAHFNLAAAELKNGRAAEAAAHFTAGCRLHPDDPAPRSKWANLLFEAGRVAESLAEHENVVRAWPSFADGRFNCGVAYAAADRFADAARELEAVVRLRPDDAGAHDNLGVVLTQLGRPAEAAVHFAEAVRLAPDSAAAKAHLAAVRAAEGKR